MMTFDDSVWARHGSWMIKFEISIETAGGRFPPTLQLGFFSDVSLHQANVAREG